ncbi:MAG: glutamate--tRNA ligase [Bacteroidetes bacterium]|nr:glutamate--tRNA ligase [Bacteroidota bacterium]
MNKHVRVRFAPSPTGPLHIGGLRTALYNFLFAKKHNGTFVLRIEDTDRSRYVPGAEEYIINSLEWCGLIPDESPGRGGDFGPYRQSERKERYAGFARELVENGHAYYAFDTPEELEEARKRLHNDKGIPFQYNVFTRPQMKNSLTMSDEETTTLLASQAPFVVRLKVPENEKVELHDLIRGIVTVRTEEIDDKILMKSDGMPTYHMANVVDDHLMQITHVIRGEEWLPSTPLHVLIYRYLGWENTMPEFAHLPLLLKPEGKGKLSKRDGLKHGYPVFPLEWDDPQSGETLTGFKESGYLPDAFINFLALLGWNPGTEQEIFSLEELSQAFSIDRIGKGGAKFDINKAKWFNQQYLKIKSTHELAGYLNASLTREGVEFPGDKAGQVADIMRDRITFPDDIWLKGQFFLKQPAEYNEKVVREKWTRENVQVLSDYAGALTKLETVSEEKAKGTLEVVLELNKVAIGKVMQALRVALTGEGGGPDLMRIISILGPSECSNRLRTAIEILDDHVKD